MTTAVRARRPRWQRWVIGLAIVVVVLALAAWIASIVLRPRPPTENEVVAQARTEAALHGGARVFTVHCAGCHLTGYGPWLGGLGLDGAAVRGFVRSGPAGMPAFTPAQVSDADIDAVAGYLKTLGAKPEKTR